MRIGLEHDLGRELDLSRRIGRRNHPERRVADVAIGRLEVRAIREVECLAAELQPELFRQLEVLLHSEIELEEARSTNRIAAGRTERTARVGRDRDCRA